MVKFNIGDAVKIIRSPYSSVNAGTITTVTNIKHEQFGKRWTLYILNTKTSKSFYEWELEKYDKKE